MKTLQNDFTTPEQSKRLLELGIPEDSANCVYDCALIGGEKYYSLSILEDELFSVYKSEWEDPCTDIIPCWSVGRLMEIAHICSNSILSYKEEANEIQKFKEEHKCETLIEAVIVCITDAVSIGSVDFSKLED